MSQKFNYNTNFPLPSASATYHADESDTLFSSVFFTFFAYAVSVMFWFEHTLLGGLLCIVALRSLGLDHPYLQTTVSCSFGVGYILYGLVFLFVSRGKTD